MVFPCIHASSSFLGGRLKSDNLECICNNLSKRVLLWEYAIGRWSLFKGCEVLYLWSRAWQSNCRTHFLISKVSLYLWLKIRRRGRFLTFDPKTAILPPIVAK